MILLLDVMSTLVYDPFAVEMPRFLGMSLHEIIERKTPGWWYRFERDEITEDEFYEGFFLDGPPIDGAGMREMLHESYRFLDGIEALLADLHASDVQMYALSNYPVWWKIIEDKLALSRFLEWRFVSCMTGFRKPDPGAYTTPIEELGERASDFIFVDDRGVNCKAAVEVGMQALEFEDADTLRAQLIALDVLPLSSE